MKYLLAKNNHKPDFTYENGLYFNTVIDRDNYISTYLFDGEEWRNQITKTTQKDRIKQDGTGDIVINENTLSRKEIYDKNYIILRDCDNDDPEFYFIINVDHQSGNQYIISVQKDVITSNPGFMKDVGRMELIEGHVNESSILDMVIDGGYKAPLKISPLDRDFDWESTYPGTDINMLNNQWLYVFIKQKTDKGNFPLFKLNGQVQPFRVLTAPLKPVIVKDNSESKKLIASINERWDSVYYFHNNEYFVDDGDIRGNQEQLEKWRRNSVINDVNPDDGNIKISFRYAKSDMATVDKIVEIPLEKWEFYKDRWFPIYIGNKESEYNKLNASLWDTNNPTYPGKTDSSNYDHIIAFEMQYLTETNTIMMRAIQRNGTSKYILEALQARGFGAWYRFWLTFAPTSWQKVYSYYGEAGIPAAHDNYIIKWPYMCGETGSYTIGLSTDDWNRPMDWNFTIKEIYQGTDTGLDNFVWNADSLLDYINQQSNPQDDAKEELITAKISSFNPIELASDGFPINIKRYDLTTGPVTPDDWENGKIYEVFKQDTVNMDKFNTYNLSKYTNKSWIQGINNYSIMIENNKEFELKPEYVYGDSVFIHEVIISPNEWTERLKWPTSIHNSDLEYSNTKEVIFATNAFNDYQANNPGALSNQQANNNSALLGGMIGTAVAGIGAAVATGGTSLVLSAGAVAKGAGTLINDRKNKRNLKHNVAMMKQQPALSTGTGSAYADLYLNNNAFGLTLVEWQYTTNQAPSVIDSVIRSGLQFQNTISTSYDKIKRPQFNYFKLTNAQEALTGVEMSIAEKQLLIDSFSAGIRLWYDPANFLKFTDESLDNPQEYNNSIFTRDMINYIDWNSDDTK